MAASKEFVLAEIGTVSIRKHPKSRGVRLSIDASGSIRVSIPKWLPYAVGVEMATRQRNWIVQQLAKQPAKTLEHGYRVGKAHQLTFRSDHTIAEPKTRTVGNEIIITYPAQLPSNHATVQAAATKAAIRCLRAEADKLLPQRLDTLALHYGFTYKSIHVRQLKTRWGSCDAQQHITLNIYLMQLPWHLIDYVLIHELAHTEKLNHSPEFWQIVGNCSTAFKALRKELKTYRPQVFQP